MHFYPLPKAGDKKNDRGCNECRKFEPMGISVDNLGYCCEDDDNDDETLTEAGWCVTVVKR